MHGNLLSNLQQLFEEYPFLRTEFAMFHDAYVKASVVFIGNKFAQTIYRAQYENLQHSITTVLHYLKSNIDEMNEKEERRFLLDTGVSLSSASYIVELFESNQKFDNYRAICAEVFNSPDFVSIKARIQTAKTGPEKLAVFTRAFAHLTEITLWMFEDHK